MVKHPLLQVAEDLAPFFREHASANEQGRRLCPEVVEALRPTGLFRMAVPAVYGGPEVPPLDMMSILETVSAADGATGWCVNISSTTSSLSGFLAPEWAHLIFDDPLGAYGGAFAPNGKGTTVEGGWQVDGRWMWGSGTQHCQWINGGVITDEREMRLMFFPASDVRFFDTWHATGLRGTGSLDYAVEGAFVPRGREVHVGKVWAQADSPVSRFPNFNLLAAGLAAVALGIGRRAIDEAVALLAAKTAGPARARAAEYGPAQVDIAMAEATLGGARAFIREEVARTWEQVVRGDRPSVEQKARLRLAAANAALAAARAVDLAYYVGGGSSVFESNPLQRCHRDIHTATQHMMVSDRNLVTYARLRLGLEAETALL
ncbi:MAG: acyl-CoA dehydrogenase family protein [Dehalococcoidia bacterium]